MIPRQADSILKDSRFENRLPYELRRRMERLFRSDFSKVRFDVSPGLDKAGILSCSIGEEIQVAPSFLRASRVDRDFILGHELAHVVQQREGRAEPTFLNVCLDENLEREANQAGEYVVSNKQVHLKKQDKEFPSRSVCQFIISIANEPKGRIDDFSNRFRTILGFIKGGEDWLNWALSLSVPSFPAASEVELIIRIQEGLHSATVLDLASVGILTHPLTLTALNDSDFDAVSTSIQSGSLTRKARAILIRNNIKTNKELNTGVKLLSSMGVDGKALFQTLSLLDQSLLSDLSSRLAAMNNQGLQIEASEYASAVSQTPREFIENTLFYLACVEKYGSTLRSQSTRFAKVESIRESLLSFTYGALRAPVISPPYSEQGLIEELRQWIGQGNQIGFPTPASCMRNLIENTTIDLDSINGMQGSLALNSEIAEYVIQAQNIITAKDPTSTGVTQDGSFRVLNFASKGASVTLWVDLWGMVTLRNFTTNNQ